MSVYLDANVIEKGCQTYSFSNALQFDLDLMPTAASSDAICFI